MTARKRKSGGRTKGGVSLKLRRDVSAGGKEEDEVESSEAPVHTITTSPPSRQPLPLPVTPNTSLLDLTVTYDYRPSVVGEGPDITTEELSSMFKFQDSPTVHPSLLPLWGDLGYSPQLPARKRPRTLHPPSPPNTTSTPQQDRFQHLDRLAQQLHQCLSEPREGQHPKAQTTLSSPHHHTAQTTLSSPHHHTAQTTLSSPHHTVQTTFTSPHHTDQTTLISPHHHPDHQQSDTIEVDDNMFWSQAADVVASNRWECAPSPEHPSTPSLDPFGESDADAFIDQLLSDGICLTTPAKPSSCELKARPRSSIGSATSLNSVSVVQMPVRESRHGTGLVADCGTVLEVARGTNVKVTCSDSKGGWGGGGREAVDESHEQLPNIVTGKCSQREIERKRELARLRLRSRQRWKPAPANTD